MHEGERNMERGREKHMDDRATGEKYTRETAGKSKHFHGVQHIVEGMLVIGWWWREGDT